MTNTISFREYLPADKARLINLFNDFQDFIVSIDPLHKTRRQPEYGQVYLHKTQQRVHENMGKFLLAVIDEKIVGFAVGVVKVRQGDDLLEGYPATYGELIELYVEKETRSQGIGTQLLQRIEEYFLEKKCDAVFIEVFAPNAGARKFYGRHGYDVRDLFLRKEMSSQKTGL